MGEGKRNQARRELQHVQRCRVGIAETVWRGRKSGPMSWSWKLGGDPRRKKVAGVGLVQIMKERGATEAEGSFNFFFFF